MYKMSSYTQNKLVCDSSSARRRSVSLKWADACAVCFALLWCEIVLPLVKLGIDLFPFFVLLILASLWFLLSWSGGALILPSPPCTIESITCPALCWFGVGGSFPYSSSQTWYPLWSFLEALHQHLFMVEITSFCSENVISVLAMLGWLLSPCGISLALHYNRNSICSALPKWPVNLNLLIAVLF